MALKSVFVGTAQAAEAFTDANAVRVLQVLNQNEIDAGKLAVASAQAQPVRDYAQKMVDLHTAAQQKLDVLLQGGDLGSVTPQDSALSAKVRDYGQQITAFLGASAGKAAFDDYYVRTQILAHANAVAVQQSLIDVVMAGALRGAVVDANELATTHLADANALQRSLGGTGTGPAAGLQCASSGKNAFSTYGAQAFLAVNQSIFDNVVADLKANGTSTLGDSFTKVGSGNPPSTRDGFPDFMGNLGAFLVWVYGGPAQINVSGKNFDGPQSMQQAHAGLVITSAQYDYFVTNIIVPALVKNGVSQADIGSCFAPPLLDPSFKASVVTAP